MKFKVIQGEKGRESKPADTDLRSKTPLTPEQQSKAEEDLEDYYQKSAPTASEKEQAEGDEEIVDEALRRQQKKTGSGNAA